MALVVAVAATLLLVGIPVGLSMLRYNRLRADGSGIHFGREQLAWSDLDAAFGVQGTEALSSAQRAQVAAPARSGTERLDGDGVRVVGGSWATGTLGALVLRRADGTLLVLPSGRPKHHREAILAAWPLSPPCAGNARNGAP